MDEKLREMIFGNKVKEYQEEGEGKLPTSIPESSSEAERPYWVDEQVGFLTIQYLLKPDIPEKYYQEFSKFLLAIDKLTALGNIRREDILRFKLLFSMVIRWYKLGLPQIARQLLAEFLFEMQLSRSVEGFFTVWQSTQRTIQEEWARTSGGGRRGGFWSRLFGGGE